MKELCAAGGVQLSQRPSTYNRASKVEWTSLFKLDQTFAIFANVANSRITHSQYAALCLKDAIVDSFQSQLGKRPSVAKQNPDIWFNLHVENDHAVISLDTSGGSLHRRGYRQQSVEAPMQETLAAAIIRLAEWHGERPLYDPMCGSGTLLSETLLHHCRIPAGYLRQKFGFEFLPDFDRALWQSIKKEVIETIVDLPEGLLTGSDIADEAVRASQTNLRCLPHGERIRITRTDFRSIPNLENTTIVCNPPYGIRMGKDENLGEFYKALGDFLKQKCQGSTAYIYFGDRKLIPNIGLRPAWRKPLKNGNLDGRLARFDIY